MTPKIPKGWRKLTRGTVLKIGDKFWNADRLDFFTTKFPGARIGVLNTSITYIRKIKPKKKLK